MSDWAVHWHEGMFLSPHHFQAADRHARRELRESEDWFHPFAWGLRGVVLDVAGSIVTLRSCEARFRDGTHLSVGPGRDVPSLSLGLADAPGGPGPTTVLLAIRAFQLGRKNVDPAPTGDGMRYRADDEECLDENKEAAGLSIRFRRLQARLLHSGQDATDYETLPVLRVERSGEAEAPPRAVPDYVPPLLALDAWPALAGWLQSLAYQIEAKVKALADQVAGRGLAFHGHDAGEAERLLKLAALNESLPPLRAIAFALGVPPFAAYLELCRVVGRLGLFTPERHPPPVLPYDHEDLGGRFVALIEQIRRALEGVEANDLVIRHFAREGVRVQVPLDEAWLQAESKMYLGIETDLSQADCDRLLTRLDRSVGAPSQVEELFARRFPGLALTPMLRLPAELQARKGAVFFEIGRDPRVWARVAVDRALAIRLNMDQATFQSEEVIRLTTTDGRGINLRFALYVVPGR